MIYHSIASLIFLIYCLYNLYFAIFTLFIFPIAPLFLNGKYFSFEPFSCFLVFLIAYILNANEIYKLWKKDKINYLKYDMFLSKIVVLLFIFYYLYFELSPLYFEFSLKLENLIFLSSWWLKLFFLLKLILLYMFFSFKTKNIKNYKLDIFYFKFIEIISLWTLIISFIFIIEGIFKMVSKWFNSDLIKLFISFIVSLIIYFSCKNYIKKMDKNIILYEDKYDIFSYILGLIIGLFSFISVFLISLLLIKLWINI